MNIFILHTDPVVAAQHHCDKHVVKMTLECAQILSTVNAVNGVPAPYKPAYVKHPAVLWAGRNAANYLWTLRHGKALAREFELRYGKKHKSEAVFEHLFRVNGPRIGEFLPRGSRTPFALCMPDHLKCDDAVVSYRKFYHEYKSYFAAWEKGRTAPSWWAPEYANNWKWNTPKWRAKVDRYSRSLSRGLKHG